MRVICHWSTTSRDDGPPLTDGDDGGGWSGERGGDVNGDEDGLEKGKESQ